MAEHVQTLTRHESSGAGGNPLGIKGVGHIEFFVDTSNSSSTTRRRRTPWFLRE